MSGPRISYICTDRGIPIDGDKGAAVHFREFGAALRRQGATVRALARLRNRKAALPFDCEALVLPARTNSTIANEVESFAGQSTAFEQSDALPAPDVVYERFSLFGFAGLRHARRHGVPLLVEVNAPLWEEAARYRGLEFSPLAREAGLSLLREADHVFAVSPILRQRLVDAGVDPSRVHVLLNGVAENFLAPVEEAPRPEALRGLPILVFVGSLKPWHGVEFLIDAAMDPRAKFGLWVVGDGPLADEAARAATRRPDRVHYSGPLPHDRIPAILAAADAAVAPYRADSPDYFCPLKVFEALASGIPLLAADVPAVTSVVPDGAPLHLFEASNIDAFFDALPKALAASRDIASTAFRPREHSWDARAAQVLGVLEAFEGRQEAS